MITILILYLLIGIAISSFGQYCIYAATKKTYFVGWILDALLWPIALAVMIRIVCK